MKNFIKNSIALLSLSLLIILSSCRSEDDLSIDPPAEAVIEANSTIALLMQRVATNDGSRDNIIDGASNLSVQLPVNVTVNGITINVNSADNYEDILDAFNLSDADDDIVMISYPITVILPDYSSVIVNSNSELNNLTMNSDDDDDIECIDFDYPITVSVFEETTETFETIRINNDNQLYDFIQNIDMLSAATINFPITVTLADGTEQIISSIQELEDAIEAADNTCDEDDNNDFDDCSTNEYTPTFFEDSMLACGVWTIDKLKRNNNQLADIYEEYIFVFNADGTIVVTENANVFDGTWEANELADAVDITINVVGLPDFNDTWELCKINLQPVEKKVELKLGTDRLRFGSNCSDNTDVPLENILEDGAWIVASYSDNGIDETPDYDGYEINFSDDGTVFATNNIDTNNGTWSVFANDGKMRLDFGSAIPFQEFNYNNWDVVSVSNTEVTIHNISSGGDNASTDILTLQKL